MGPHRVGWPIVTSRYCKLQSLRPLLSALAGVGRVIRLESSWICSLANPPRARREQKPSLSCAFRRILLLVMRFLVPSADRDGRADCRFGLTTRARFACQNHRPAREKRPRQATHVCRRRTCFLRRRWALVSPTGRLKFPCLLLPESSILCQHVHAVLPLAFA